MAKFICITQHAHLQSVRGPKGINYETLRGLPFVVTEKEDIAYFEKNKRFEKIGLAQAVARMIQKKTVIAPQTISQSEEMDMFLTKAGINEKSKEMIKKLHGSVGQLQAENVAGNRFDIIPRRQASKLIKSIEEIDDNPE